MFDKILIANRGEIALRVLRACKELGVATVAVHSTADVDAMHVKLADESVCIGPPSPNESYLNIPAIIAACEITGATAVHPGYGFLSENSRFVEVLDHHKIKFIGPSAEQIRLMGDKIVAKKTAQRFGVPCVPGSPGPVSDLREAVRIVDEIGCPVLIKAVSGGGGRGMKIVHSVSELENAFFLAKMEARTAFGNDAVYIEKYLNQPRHIEIQVLGDGRGGIVHLGERECSLQRRHQKLWEEAFSPILTAEKRAEITRIVVKAMQEFQYMGLGTLEFLYANDQFYFIEMNTRIQVEHPVTEMITGLDLVNEQIRVAAQNKLLLTQENIHFKGHAIECRINAEHPFTFQPSPGTIGYYHPPGGLGVRVESAAYQGYTISPFYDSLIGKLIVHGQSRSECLMRLRRALDEFIIDGIDTTLALFRNLAHEEDIQNGMYHIHWLENFLEEIHPQ